MKYGSLVLGKCDYVMIKGYHRLNHTYADYAHKNTLDILDENMLVAIVVDEQHVPSDIVQLYAATTVVCNARWRETFQLVPPSEENIKKNKISVVSTLGASIIGLSEGDVVKYGLPGNIMSLKIEKVVHHKRKEPVVISNEVLEELLPKNYKKNLSLNL